jgi:putative addiction module component (TIGR02574 family)
MSLPKTEDSNLLLQIKKLSIAERVLIVEDIWDSIILHNENLSVTENQKEDLDKRYKHYKNNREKGVSWTKVKRRLESKL